MPRRRTESNQTTPTGFVVQLVGSKTWILYDELLPFPRADLKYKPAAADLGEPIAVLELRPGDLMYIPRSEGNQSAGKVERDRQTDREMGGGETTRAERGGKVKRSGGEGCSRGCTWGQMVCVLRVHMWRF